MAERGEDRADAERLADEFQAWLNSEDSETHELEHLWPDLRIEAEEIAVVQIERLIEFRSRARDDKTWWLDAVRSAHLALTAAMVSALEGSSGVGAMRPKAAKKTLQWLEARDRTGMTMPREETLSFLELIEALGEPGRLQFGSAVVLGDDKQALARELNWFRELIDHPKFTRWSVPIEDVDGATALALDLIDELMGCVPQRYDPGQRRRVSAALQRL